MAKYSTLAFVGSAFIATIAVPKIRVCYHQPLFYLALIAGLAIIAPNLAWLWEHNFVAFHWVDIQIKRQFNPALFIKLLSIYYPLLFLWWIYAATTFSSAGLPIPINASCCWSA